MSQKEGKDKELQIRGDVGAVLWKVATYVFDSVSKCAEWEISGSHSAWLGYTVHESV